MEQNSVSKECCVCGSIHMYLDPLLKIADTEQWKSVRVLEKVFKLNVMECLTFLLEEQKLSNCFCQPCAVLVNETVEKADELEKVQKGFQALQAQLYQKAKFSISIHPHGSSGPKTKLGLKLIGEENVSMASATGGADKPVGDPSTSANSTGKSDTVKTDYPDNNETKETSKTVPTPQADDKNTDETVESDLTNNNSQDENSRNDTVQENADFDDEMGDTGHAENDDLTEENENIVEDELGEKDNVNQDQNQQGENYDNKEDDDEDESSLPFSSDDDHDEDYHPSSPSPSYSECTQSSPQHRILIDFPENENGRGIQHPLALQQVIQSGEFEIPYNNPNHGNNGIVPRARFGWPYPCLVCNEFSLHPQDLGHHYRTIHPHGPWICVDCYAPFKSMDSLKSHRKKLHNFPHSIIPPPIVSVGAEDVKPFATPRMPQLSPQFPPPPPPTPPPCSSRQAALEGSILHHPASTEQSNANLVPQDILHPYHHPTYETLKNWKCPECPRTFQHNSSLSRHRRTSHKGQGNKWLLAGIMCLLCDRHYSSSGELNLHYRVEHPNTEWKCPKCPRVLNRREGLYNHRREVHKDLPWNKKNRNDGSYVQEQMKQHSQAIVHEMGQN